MMRTAKLILSQTSFMRVLSDEMQGLFCLQNLGEEKDQIRRSLMNRNHDQSNIKKWIVQKFLNIRKTLSTISGLNV